MPARVLRKASPMNNGNDTEQEICPHCGVSLEVGSDICTICGNSVNGATEEPVLNEDPGHIECSSCGTMLDIGSTECFLCETPVEDPSGDVDATSAHPTDWDLGIVGGDEDVEPEVEEDLAVPDIEDGMDEPDIVDAESDTTDIDLDEDVEPDVSEALPLGPDEYHCPSCQKPVPIGAEQCPSCWTALSEMIYCPKCSSTIPLESESCPDCFAKLENGVLLEDPDTLEEPLEIEEELPDESDELYSEEESTEYTEEFGIECPACNAFVSQDDDICSECGMLLVAEDDMPVKKEKVWIPKPPKGRDYQKDIAVILVFVLLISAAIPFFVSLPRVDRGLVSIDGQFGDWLLVGDNIDAMDASANVDIINYKLATDITNAYFYTQISGTGTMFGDSVGDNVRIFVDVDQDDTTGYKVQGIGADYQIKVFGHDNFVESAACLRFNNARANNDINGFESYAPAVPFAEGNELEVRVNLTDIGSSRGSSMTAVYYVANANGQYDFSDHPVSNDGEVLHVSQSSAVAQSGLITGNAPILNLNLTATGEYVLIDDIDLPSGYTLMDSDNNAVSYPLNITNTSTVFTVYFNTASATSGSFFTYEIMADDIIATDADTVVQGVGAFAYVDNAPGIINIDGAFADWDDGAGGMRGTGITDPIDDVMNMERLLPFDAPRLDVTELRELQENDNINLYLDVEGDMFAGFDVPVEEDFYYDTIPTTTRAEPVSDTWQPQPEDTTIGTRQASPDLQPPTEYMPQLGEDAVLIFIDINNDTSDGFLVNGMGADRLLDIRGQYGQVTNITAYSFDSPTDQNMESWMEISSTSALAASDGAKMEASISLTDLGMTIGTGFSVHFHIMDWNKNGDIGEELVYDTAINSRRSSRFDPPLNNGVTGIVHMADGLTPIDATVIADYPAGNSFFVSSTAIEEISYVGVGRYFFNVPVNHQLSFYATDGNFVNNTDSEIDLVSDSAKVDHDLDLTTPTPVDAPLNFSAYSYGDGDIVLNWDIGTPPAGGFRIYRSNYVWNNQLVFNKTAEHQLATVSAATNWYLDTTVPNGESYYYLLASLDGGGNEISFAPLEKATAADKPTMPFLVYGFVKDQVGALVAGASVSVELINATNDLNTFATTTDAIGRYTVTLQPNEYRNPDVFNDTIWCNATIGGIEAYNTTSTLEWYPPLNYYSDRNDSAICNITIIGLPNITVAKMVSDSFASPGQALTYTIWFNNTGISNASFVWVNDTLPNNTTYVSDTAVGVMGYDSSGVSGQLLWFNFTDVAPGIHFFTVTVDIDSDPNLSGILTNNVSVNYTDAFGLDMPGSNDTANTTINMPIIIAGKTADVSFANPGDLITYTIYFNNSGSAIASHVWVNDTLPVGVTYISDTNGTVDPLIIGTMYSWHFIDILPFTNNSFTVTVQVDAVANGAVLINEFECSYQAETGVEAESNATAPVTVYYPFIDVDKVVDLSLAQPGDTLIYTVWFNNTNLNSVASMVWINDTLPAGVIYISDTAGAIPELVSNNTATSPIQYIFANVGFGVYFFDITVMILNTTTFPWLNNTVVCEYTPNNVTSSAEASTELIRPLISIDKIANQTYALPGETVIYTIWFNNTGTASAMSVWIYDTLPGEVSYISDTAAGVMGYDSSGVSGQDLWFNFTNVAPGDYSFDIVVLLDAALVPGTQFWNFAYLEYVQDNGLPSGPFDASDDIIVLEGPYIDIVKQVSQTIVNTGDMITYFIYFNNTGNGNAATVWLNDTLPDGVVYVNDTAASTGYTYTLTQVGQVLEFEFSNVPGGSNNFLVIDVMVTSEIDMDPMTNTVTCEYVSDTGIAGPPSSDSADITVMRPIISVSKTVDLDIAAPGDVLIYTINFDNTGSFSADVWINDTLPAGVNYIGYNTSGVVPDNFDNSGLPVLSWYFDTLPVGNHWINVMAQIDVITPSGSELNNTVELNYSCTSSDYQFAGSTDHAVTLVSSMIVDKTVDMQFANPGDFLNYTIYFNNTSNFTISNVWINDTLPVGVTWVNDTAYMIPGFNGSWDDGTIWYYNFINVGFGYNSFIITVQIDAGLAPGTWVNNTVDMDYTNDVGDMMPGSDANASTMVNRPVIDIVKIVDMSIANPGDMLTYTIWFNNTGSVNASHVWLNDTLPSYISVMGLPSSDLAWDSFNASTYSFYFTDVPVGDHFIIINVLILLTTPDGTVLENTVVCEYETDAGNDWSSSDNATTLVVIPIITVEKSASVTEAMPGDTITYTIWFNNTGSGNANIWINDTLPSGVTFQSSTSTGVLTVIGDTYSWFFANVAPGDNSFTITVMINTDVANGTVLVNDVICDYEADNGLEQTAEDWANVTVLRPVIVVEKIVSSAEANPGDTLIYTIYFNNTGGADASSVWLEDVFPIELIYQSHTAGSVVGATFAGAALIGQTLYFNFTNVAPGDHSFTITFIVDSTTPDCPTLVNTVDCEYEWSGQWLGNQTSDTAETHINRPTFIIDKTVDHAVASPGFFLNYTITFTNVDSGIAAFLWLNDTLPDGVVYISDNAASLGLPFSFVPAGQDLFYEFTGVPGDSTYTFTIMAWIDDAYGHMGGDELWNWVWINYTAESGYPFTGPSDSALTTISDMAISKSVNLTNAAPGDSLQYTIWFNNTSGTNLASVWINDTLPAGVTWVSDTSALVPSFAGSWNDGITWYYNFTNVAPGDHSFVIIVTIDAVDPGTFLNNTATLDYTNGVGVAQIGSVDTASTLVDEAIMVVEKTVNTDWAQPGDTLTYTIWYNNTGVATAGDVWVNDTLPAGVTYVSDTSTGALTIFGNMYSWHFTNLAPNNYFFTIDVTVNDTVSDGTILVNTVTLDYQTGGYEYESSTAWANTTIYTPSMTIEKVVDMEYATWGDTLTYTIYFNNTGMVNCDVELYDILPADVTLVSSDADTLLEFVDGGSSGQEMWANYSNVAPGSYEVHVTVTVNNGLPDGTVLDNWIYINYTNVNGIVYTNYTNSDDSATTIVLAPDMSIMKLVDRWVASPGDLLTYTIIFMNTGSTAGNVWINDTLPAGVNYVSDGAWSIIPEYDSSGIAGLDLWFYFTDVGPGFYAFPITVQIDLSALEGDILTNNVTLNYTTTTDIELPGDQ
ncbi:MAG: DUF11 domain-containing protein, partial [Thermoplasmata archaeon]|nr:DUF11 domain-containing protein [Thermoplasmata archaeon]